MIKSKPLRKALELLLLLLFIFSSLHYYTSYLQCFRFSTTSLVHRLDLFISRKAMFLFCNFIILFVAKDFRLITNSTSPNHLYYKYPMQIKDHYQPSGSNSIEVKVHAAEEKQRGEFVASRSDCNKAESIAVEDKAIVLESVGSLEVVMVEGGGVGEEALGVEDELELLCTEELNRRFEEFIEREKIKRRLEDLQLVKVS